jgi:uncharacterized protein YegP (UPF0339 family)
MKFPPMEFVIFEDNGGHYHWTIVAADGATLARSGGFASYRRRRASREAGPRRGRSATEAAPTDLTARRDAASNATDAEHWLDEGGSFSSEAVANGKRPR